MRFKHPVLSLALVLLVLIGCQKEKSFEQPLLNPAKGSLKADGTGDCNPIRVRGTYTPGTNLNDSNYVDVEVTVTKAGSYTIVTDTVNGYSFKGTGNFNAAGVATVRLKGSGKPLAAGQDDFIVLFDSSFCFFTVSVNAVSGGGPANYSLAGGPGACGNFTPNGNYVLNTALTSANTVSVGVNVTTPGTYTIKSDTVNGFYFVGTGTFTAAGNQTVVLNGSGTPNASGTANFTAKTGTSTCTFSINVSATPPASAVFTLAGAPGACGNFSAQGTYTINTALAAGNTVTLGVNVTTAGAYTITTNTVNGMSFSKTGTFAATGVQTVVLNGSGTPTVAGAANFTVTAGSSTCTFTITVNNTPTVPNDYYPRTVNSNWSYEFNDDATDTVLRKVIAPTLSAMGNTYTIYMATFDASQGFDSAGYIRKSGGNYYEYIDMGDYYGFDNPLWTEFIFLKDDQAVNHTWTTNAFTGTVQGTSMSFREKYKILQKDVSVVVNGTTYPNTIVVEQRTEYNAMGVWQDMSSVFGYVKAYYAKGVGLIKYEFIDSGGAISDKLEITRSVVF